MSQGSNNSQLRRNSEHERIKRQQRQEPVRKSDIKHKAPKPKTQTPRRKEKPKDLEEVYVGVGEMDHLLLFVIIALVLIGIIMVFSASSYSSAVKFGTPYTFFIKQTIFAAIGFIGLSITANFHYNNYMNKWPAIMYAVTSFFLVLVLFVGKDINGAKRWLEIPGTGGLGFQPSELAKITMIIVTSSIIAKHPKILNSFKGTVQVGAVVIFMAALIGKENMSTSLIVMAIGFGIIFVVSPFTKQFIALGITGVVAILAYLAIEAYLGVGFRGGRFKAWLDPFSDVKEFGFQTVQSLYAIASGGFFGLGLGNSRQKLSYLPESQNDFIFAIICEELGFFGAMIIIGLYILLIYRGVQIALKAPNLFGTLVAFGIVILVATQVIINIAVTTNTIPNTGIALPFISYGGTSLVFMISTMGILLNISRYTRK